MHILFLTHYFPPEVNAPASRTYENAKIWVAKGHRVTVMTCVPNHPRGIAYPGYENRLAQWDRMDGIDVLRIKTYLSPNKGFLKRILNYLSFLFAAIGLCSRVKKPDIVISTSPQFFCGMAGYFVSRLKKVPWILEIRDLWPDSILAVGAIQNRFIIRSLKILESFLYGHADRIVALTDPFKTHIRRKGFGSKVVVIPNGADLKRYVPGPRQNEIRKTLKLEEQFIVSYIGTHGMAHGLFTILEAAQKLSGHSQIRFLMVGDGALKESLVRQKNRLNLTNVLMLGQQPKEKIPDFLAASNASMVLLKKTDVFKTVIPSKLFEAMAMMCPIILGVEGESRRIVANAGCGLWIAPENADQLANAILKLASDQALGKHLGQNGRQFVTTYYNRALLANQFLDTILSVAPQRRDHVDTL